MIGKSVGGLLAITPALSPEERVWRGRLLINAPVRKS